MLKIINLLRIYIILIFFSFTTSVFSQNKDEFEKEREKEEVRIEYMNYLTEEGYRPEVDSDGDVKFKREGRTYYIMARNKRIFWISVSFSKENACEQKFLLSLDKVNRRFLNVTTAVNSDCNSLSISSRSWIVNPDDWKYILTKSMDSIDNAYEASRDYYNDL